MKRRIVLLGPPASGKGTQAEMISATFQIPTASPGAMFREEKRAGTSFGLETDRLTSRGLLVPDEIVCGVVRSWLEKHDGEFVFDGFPRSAGQADSLEATLAERHTPLQVVFSLEADRATLEHRVLNRLVCSVCRTNVSIGMHVPDPGAPCPKCGGELIRRSDDTAETLALRMREYAEKTRSLIAYYRERHLLRAIDAARPPEVVFAALSAILAE
ncbi:MAG: nucleoside monophosphate kinase [Verrucomicrobiota bacterium]|nr:nucleoside monophosphate kinase [Verrucomicrobiota bacterium]